jgi:hypothetical protein
MSTTSTFALGLGGGATLWYLTKNKHTRTMLTAPASVPTTTTLGATPATSSISSKPAASTPRNRLVRIVPAGIMVDGTRTDLSDAVRQCAAAGGASITVDPSASASTYAALVAALDRANVPMVRNAPRRNAGALQRELSSTFTLVVFPEGVWGTSKRVRYFKATTPTTWEDARDRLAAAKLLDRDALSPNGAGAWRLVTDPARFREDRAEPLPDAGGRPRGAKRRMKRYTLEGRTIVRDGEAIVYLDRVDLGDQRYAISPHEADRLAERIVSLLNQHGARDV